VVVPYIRGCWKLNRELEPETKFRGNGVFSKSMSWGPGKKGVYVESLYFP